MNRSEWEPERGERRKVGISIGLEGPPGGGKTVSALLLAQGIQRVRGGRIIVIDTENRARKYAGISVAGNPPFDFDIVRFNPPFRANRYMEAIEAQLPRNPACIIVDSMSDEHEGVGGRLDWAEEHIDKMLLRSMRNVPPDYNPREDPGRQKWSQEGWKPSSMARTRLANFINRIGEVPLILTFRAREKTKPVEQEKNGRKIAVPTNVGYEPIAPVEIVHQLDIVCLLPPRADGLPLWKSGKERQDFVLKLPEQFRGILTPNQRITPEVGEALGRWAEGDDLGAATPSESKQEHDFRDTREEDAVIAELRKSKLYRAAIKYADQGRVEWRAWVAKLNEGQREALDLVFEDDIKPRLDAWDLKHGDITLPDLQHEGTP
jgi:hypothetical protein